MKRLIPSKLIEHKILLVRGSKVMLDRDLAMLYQVPTKSLNLAVKRNLGRFPKDFMFQLNRRETAVLRFQIETSNAVRGGRRYPPYVFTEQGVAMLSSVLKSERAIRVNIQIMRTFMKLKRMLHNYTKLRNKIEVMEKRYDRQFKVVFQAIEKLLMEEEKPKRQIGFHP
jgi:hypothetical protein